MAEPNWELLERVLQQLQADTAQLKQDSQELKQELADIRKLLSRQNVQVLHALGTTTDANLRTVMVSEDVERLEQQLEELTKRVDLLEHPHA